jgi:hypothetical protein
VVVAGEGHARRRTLMASRGVCAVLGLLLMLVGVGLGFLGIGLLLGHLLVAVRPRRGLARLALHIGRPFLHLLLGRARHVLRLHLARLHLESFWFPSPSRCVLVDGEKYFSMCQCCVCAVHGGVMRGRIYIYCIYKRRELRAAARLEVLESCGTRGGRAHVAA